MERIESRENRKILDAASLKEKKFRRSSGRYLVEGEKMVREALLCGTELESIFLREGNETRYDFLPEERTYLVTERAFCKLCDTVQPQGIVAVARIAAHPFAQPQASCLILDGVSDAGNLGTILRTAAAVGIEDVYLSGCADPYNPKCVRSSMSGIFFLRLHEAEPEQIVRAVRGAGLPVVVADMGGQDLFEMPRTDFALVVGSEAHGVSRYFRAQADMTVRLSMQHVESLNAAVCAGVMMYVLKNKR